MKKKETIILSIIVGIALLFFIFTKMQNRGLAGRSSDSFVTAPDYTQESYQESDKSYQKFSLFRDRQQKSSLKEGGQVVVTPDKDTLFVSADGKAIGVKKRVGNKIVLSGGDTVRVDKNGKTLSKEKSFFGFGGTPVQKPTLKKQRMPQETSQPKGASSLLKSFEVKDTVKPKPAPAPPRPKPTTKFYRVSVELPKDTIQADHLLSKEMVLMFFKAAFYSSQSMRVDKTIQVKVLEAIKTPLSNFPSGTIFYGNIEQEQRRFTTQFHRALYNYSDYPIHEPFLMYDKSYTEGMLILNFEDEIKEESTDEFLTANSQVAQEVAAQQAIANSMIRMAEGATKSVKKKKLYTIEVSDAEEVYIGVRVPKEWFYQTVNKQR